MIKAIHCGDLHLGSPFSLDNDSVSRQTELIDDFKKMMAFCRAKEIDLLLVAGDLFDTPFPSRKCAEAVVSEFEDFNGEIFISPGNHDPLLENSVYKSYSFPKNVHIFCKNELTPIHLTVKGAEICVWGNAFTSYSNTKNPLITDHVTDKSILNIVSVHGDLYDQNSCYAPISQSSITEFSPNYLALAHVHKRSPLTFFANTAYGYCGSLSGRDFGETGIKGCYYLEFSEHTPSAPTEYSFIPFGKRHYEEVKIDVTGITNGDVIMDLLKERNILDADCHLRIILSGESDITEKLINSVKSMVGNTIAHIEIADNTVEKPDYSTLENDPSVSGEFYRLLKSEIEGGNPQAALALRLGLNALNGNDPISTFFNDK